MQTGWTSLIPHVRRVIGVSSLFFPSAIEAKFIVYGKRHHNPLPAWHPHCLCNHFSKYVTVYPSVQDSWQGTTACCRSPSPPHAALSESGDSSTEEDRLDADEASAPPKPISKPRLCRNPSGGMLTVVKGTPRCRPHWRLSPMSPAVLHF